MIENGVNGESCEIRLATPEDAEALLEHLRLVLEDTPVMIPKLAEEMKLTVEQEHSYLCEFLAKPNQLFLVACDSQGQIVGNLDYRAHRCRNLAHTALLGMAIQSQWRNQGLGSRLMQAGLDWALHNPLIKRLELFVYANNAPAIALYQKFGYQLEGRRRGAVLYEGEYCDDLVMGRWLG